MELYRKVYINSEDDLPKEAGDYFVQLKTGHGRILYFPFNGDVGWNIDVHDWIQNVDFYLQPYELDLPTEEEIKIQAHKDYPYLDVEWNITTIKRALWIACAKWMIEEIKKRNDL